MKFPRGADDVASAPIIGGFGISEPTPNGNLGPVTPAEADNEPQAEDGWRVYQTAWWQWVAPKSGWVRIDLHQTWTNIASMNEPGSWGPETTLGVFIGEPGNLWPVAGGSTSRPVGADMPYMDNGINFPTVGTSEEVVLVDAGRTYYIQAGMYSDTLNQDPTALTVYTLRISELICHPVEITLPTVGPLYNSPDGLSQAQGVPIIVGGDDALLRDSNGYVDFPDTGARLGFWMQPAVNHPDWPPPANARHPNGRYHGPAFSYRWEAEVLPGAFGPNEAWSGITYLEGNQGGSYQFYGSLTPFPNLTGDVYIWDASAPNGDEFDDPPPPSLYGVWDAQGGWEYDPYPTAIRGPNVKDRGIVEGVFMTEAEDFLANGEYRTIYDPADDSITVAAKWYQWFGSWGFPPFFAHSYTTTLVALDPPDWGIWFGSNTPGYTLAQGLEYAMPYSGFRVHWLEWRIRWITFEVVKGELTGGLTDDRRAFSDG